MDKTMLCGMHPTTPAPGLPFAVRERGIAPNRAAQGTAVPAGSSAVAAAQVAVAGVRSTDLPGSPPRGAPV